MAGSTDPDIVVEVDGPNESPCAPPNPLTRATVELSWIGCAWSQSCLTWLRVCERLFCPTVKISVQHETKSKIWWNIELIFRLECQNITTFQLSQRV